MIYHEYINTDCELQGLKVVESALSLEITSNIFRSVPLYVASDFLGGLHLFSDFEYFYNCKNMSKEIDKTGFWEVVLFGNSIGKRTLYKDVQQLPADSTISITKKDNSYSIVRKNSFKIEEERSIKSLSQAASFLFENLSKEFSLLDPKKKYVLGISGGMDSRLTLAMLSKYLSPQNVYLYTYGSSRRSLEYRYACDVAKALGFRKPIFHVLNAESYKNALNYLPRISGGQVGINHCHVFDLLRGNYFPEDAIHLSTYYSDAILGWSVKETDSEEDWQKDPYSQIMTHSDILDDETAFRIRQDIAELFKDSDTKSTLSSLDEYKYLVERNPKFHVFLTYLLSQTTSTIAPFVSESLFYSSLSIPRVFRAEKRLVDAMLETYFPKTMNIGNISSRFQWGGKYSNIYSFYQFRMLNLVNAIVRKIFRGNFEFSNKYQTEQQELVLRKHLTEELEVATSSLASNGLISLSQKNILDKVPLRNKGVGERYHLISVAALLTKSYMDL